MICVIFTQQLLDFGIDRLGFVAYTLGMGISYKPLFHMLVERDMKKTDLTKAGIISNPTLTKLAKHQPVDGKIMAKLCAYFNCQPGDIMEFIPDAPSAP